MYYCGTMGPDYSECFEAIISTAFAAFDSTLKGARAKPPDPHLRFLIGSQIIKQRNNIFEQYSCQSHNAQINGCLKITGNGVQSAAGQFPCWSLCV